MKFAAGVLIALSAPPAPGGASSPQEWLGEPRVPEVFEVATGNQDEPASASRRDSPQVFRSRDPEPSLPGALTAQDIQTWREQDDLRRIREGIGEAAFGLPLLLPQTLLETFLPRGLAVGPTTFLYRTGPASTSLSLVVLDQALFHEAQFLAQAQALASDGVYSGDLRHGQRRVLRQSLMGGFRATYAVPRVTLDLILETAEAQGAVGYLLAPPVAGALLYSKGLDQKVELRDDVSLRFRLASGQQWLHGARSDAGVPALSLDLRLCGLPVGLIATFDVSARGMTASFLGLGTSLDAVEELLGSDASAGLVPIRAR